MDKTKAPELPKTKGFLHMGQILQIEVNVECVKWGEGGHHVNIKQVNSKSPRHENVETKSPKLRSQLPQNTCSKECLKFSKGTPETLDGVRKGVTSSNNCCTEQDIRKECQPPSV